MRYRAAALTVGLTLTLSAALAPVAARAADEPTAAAQLEFGVDMAKRGLWNEALFRFKKALDGRPGDAQVLNNIAVSYEALGLFDQALDAYRQALAAGQGNRDLRANYSRFLEFYQAFKPAGESGDEAGSEGGESDESPAAEGSR
jgi:Tfp pilus assembly protein PilF